MADAERAIRALLREMAAEVGTVRYLSGEAHRKAITGRVVTVVLAAIWCVAILAGGLRVAEQIGEANGSHTRVSGTPRDPSAIDTPGEHDRGDGLIPGPRARLVTAGSFRGHHYVLRTLSLDEATCLELHLGRGSGGSHGVCSLVSGDRRHMDYSEVAIPDTNYVVVLGLVSSEVHSVRLDLEDGRRIDASIASATGSLHYFHEFIVTDEDVVTGVALALDEDGRVLEEGRLCSRHVWGRNGNSLCE